VRGALVPHAPLLLPEVTSKGDALRDIWDGLSRLRIEPDALVIVLSPHAPATGIYERPVGSLAGFGLPGIRGEFKAGSASLTLDPLREPLDHGALVPLLLLDIPNEVVAIGMPEASTDVVRELKALGAERELFVLSSAHTSACLTERAPLPYSFDAVRLESRFITEIESDCAAALDLADGFNTVGGSCSHSTLSAFGDLFAGAEGSVLAYGSPFGVGYAVIAAEIDV
jgi:hypothetical protein